MTSSMRSDCPPAEPRTTLAIDHTGPYPMVQGYRYILAITCITSKHLVLIPQKTKTAIETACMLLAYFRYYGFPLNIFCDNGARKVTEHQTVVQHASPSTGQFTSGENEHFSKEFVDHTC